jgi:thymidine phosphorylase
MDVKFGSGAFMEKYDDAKTLAESIVTVANGAGLPTVGLLTDMNQTLGRAAGNAVEVKEAIEFLHNRNVDPRLYEVTAALTAELLVLGKLAGSVKDARQKIEVVLKNGKAAEHFARMTVILGGPADLMEKPEKYLTAAPLVKDFHPPQKFTVSAVNARAIGIGIVEMGGGRAKPSDTVDHSVGITNVAQIGEEVGQGGRPLATIHAKDEAGFRHMSAVLTQAMTSAGKAPLSHELVKERIAA